MDALILNAGHSQLEEQLKIAAACGVAERRYGANSSDITAVIATEDSDEMTTIGDSNEGLWLISVLEKKNLMNFAFLRLFFFEKACFNGLRKF
ncbi:unnamed protein product [Litomosoides sigmodontis]|uniref:Uncharacterized protein n=1 Tax=Litomosoides sigmodontis TaxID=42156 RepID=A0A3P6TY55_LITSI|nr:unnamed protein product [Litomosoides sigmodontis]